MQQQNVNHDFTHVRSPVILLGSDLINRNANRASLWTSGHAAAAFSKTYYDEHGWCVDTSVMSDADAPTDYRLLRCVGYTNSLALRKVPWRARTLRWGSVSPTDAECASYEVCLGFDVRRG